MSFIAVVRLRIGRRVGWRCCGLVRFVRIAAGAAEGRPSHPNHPCYRANEIPRISRHLKPEDFAEAVNITRECGLERFGRGQKPLGSAVSRYVEQSCF